MNKRVVVIGGDGIGPEVTASAIKVLEAVHAPLDLTFASMGLECYRRTGSYLPEETVNALDGTDACLFGAITSPDASVKDYRSPILWLRKHFDLYANVRPVKRLVPDLGIGDLNAVIVRENTEGMYTGIEHAENGVVTLERKVSEKACRRLVRYAIEHCRREGIDNITCVHKSNVLRLSDGMFKRVFYEEVSSSGLKANDLLVDAAAAALIIKPKQFGCLVTLNLYGDILSDEAAAVVGGLGFAPSVNHGDRFDIYEPTHGSAPDIAGKGIANPTAAILSSSMMLRDMGSRREATLVDAAVVSALRKGVRTPDAGGSATTDEFTETVLAALEQAQR
ncbi:MAG TPA: isocitrate/isopropylmalate dehydrogenase family protein [Methanomassiliicoccales archaeon]|jgi:isopropylmalate/isohomocitrate dehydrogenase-like protein